MKHLKTYEVRFGNFNGILKKYILLKHHANASNFDTLELYSINENDYTCILLKHYNFETKRLSEFIDNTSSNEIPRIFKWEDEILLQSDDLDEALGYFDMVIDTKKFNI